MPDRPLGLQADTPKLDDLVKRAAARDLPIVDLFAAAAALKQNGANALAVDLYKTWIAYNPDDPLLYAVTFNYATAMSETGDRLGAMNAFRTCIRLKPDFYPPYINLGRVLEDVGQAGLAVLQWLELSNRLSTIAPDALLHKKTALEQAGRVLESLDQDTAAEDALKQCMDLTRDAKVIQHWIALRMRQCKWPVLVESEHVKRVHLVAGLSPLSLANLADDPMFGLAKAFAYSKETVGFQKGARRHAPGRAGGPRRKLRIGYVSSDLRDHAVGFAMTDVVETHDRAAFEIHAFYCGIPRPDATKERIRRGADHWVDINGLTDEQAAAAIADAGVDILVDLNGYTKDARTRVFALRPAPVAVNWFGFPGSMGSPYHHYLIADPHVVPADSERYYSETVLRLPCYQPNDRKRAVAPSRQSRADEGLPDEAMVFCCLNGMQKLTEATFRQWMTILGQVPGSVLWLLTGTAETNARLRQRAADAGVAPERLVFAQKKANPDHLARYPLADLFLDNRPYGAHTTAADALWMGVPVLTLPGRSFASRVCASLVRAAGIGEMVCASPDQYVARAIGLGRNRAELAAVKQRLVAGRDTCLLFDTPRLVASLEDLYWQMWADFARGALPKPDLTNLDVYNAIGAELDLEATAQLDDAGYRALYRDKLVEWDDAYPLGHDGRLWGPA